MSGFSIKTKLSTNALYGLALAFICGIALLLRVYFPYDDVFVGDWVKFKWFDSWYHMRLVENLVQHFPHRIYFDPYTFYPHGQSVFFAPFFDLLLGFFIWLFGLGSPSPRMIETVGAYFPAILGALVAIPVFFIGKELFNKKAGLIAAALVVILPGQFLLRSLLGFTDHHVAETLFSSTTILFLILAVKSSKQKEISFDSLLTRDWAMLKKPLIYSLVTGISLGFYLLSWAGGALVIFIIFVFAFIQYVSDHIRGRTTDYLCIIGIPSLLIALLMILPFLGSYGEVDLQILSLLIGMLALLALSGLSFLMTRMDMRRAYYPLALVVLGGIGLAAFYLIAPSVLNSVLDRLSVLRPTGGAETILEARPLFYPMGSFSLSTVWDEFTTCFYLALISLVIVAYLVIKEGAADKTLLLVWSVIMLVATIGQNRFAYYFAVNVALLTAYLSWKTVAFAGTRIASEAGRGEKVYTSEKLRTGKVESKSSKKAKRKKAKARGRWLGTLLTRHPAARYGYGIIAAVAVFFLVFYPNIGRAIDVADQRSYPTDDWHDALVWMRDNTPDPFEDFDDPNFYYQYKGYAEPAEGEDYAYPESAYGVMSWWDYGHWITYIAHRIPNANPHQHGAVEAARFFTAQSEAAANEVLDKLGSRYVIMGFRDALYQVNPEAGVCTDLPAMIEWAGKDQSDLFEYYYQPTEEGKFARVLLYYPAYYQSMCSRLYVFGGEEWDPQETPVISWTEQPLTDSRGNRFIAKVIDGQEPFADYDDAKAFVEANPGHTVVGTDPLISPVPLEELEHYKLVYKSPRTVAGRGADKISEVEIFEYIP